MEKTCEHCGQLNPKDKELCIKCGKELTLQISQIERKKQNGLSIGSLVLAGIVLIPLFWLDVVIIDSNWALDYFAGHYGDRYYIVIIASGIYLLLTAIGIVLASIGFKKGNKILSLSGIISNVILIIIIIIKVIVLNIAFFH
ncbi:MAG: hypothetical protein FK734_21485 [Asgard group archaeon]|nr:hypothetical protein [Asgard group archaeon]